MRARFALALAALLLFGAQPLAAAGEPLRFDTPTKIDALKLVDVDGDGRADVSTISGRTVCVWTTAKDAQPSATPRWRVELPKDISFVDIARYDQPSLLCLGEREAGLLQLEPAGAAAWKPLQNFQKPSGLGWTDGTKAFFAALHVGREDSGLHVVPREDGWALGGPSTLADGQAFDGLARREVVPAGPYLEDVSTVTMRLPHVFSARKEQATGVGPSGKPIYLAWSLLGDRLRCWTTHPDTVDYDLSFLPTSGQRRLLSLDGDEFPDVVHGDGDNREVKYAFFRVPEPQRGAAGGPDVRPPAAFLRLSGFNLDPDAVDLNNDGLQDFVVTTIAVDHQNTLRAVTTGKVTATTLAFLQRKQAPDTPMFASQPDATVTSEIGVRVRFGYAGTIDVQRSFTILTTADLDGDGRKDLVIRVGPGTLAIRKGTAEGVWTPEPTLVEIPPLAAGEEVEAYGANLDGKPGDEVLLLYRAPEGQPDRLLLLRR